MCSVLFINEHWGKLCFRYGQTSFSEVNFQDVRANILQAVPPHGDWKQRAIHHLMLQMHSDLTSRLPNAEKILRFEALCVHPDYRRQSIAAALCQRSIETAKAMGCSHVLVEASNVRSQALLIKLGFREVKRIKYDDFEYEGVKVFAGYDDGFGTTAAKLLTLDLMT